MIYEIPLSRMQQIVAAIQSRRYLGSREEGLRFSWLARVLASYIAAGYMSDDNRKAIDGAALIAFDDIEAILRQEQADQPRENSFERIQAVFGPLVSK